MANSRWFALSLALSVVAAGGMADDVAESNPKKFEALLGPPALAADQNELGVPILQFVTAQAMVNNTILALPQSSGDGYTEIYGVLVYSNDGHGHDGTWSKAEITNIDSASPLSLGNAGSGAKFFMPFEDEHTKTTPKTPHTSILSVPAWSEFVGLGYPWDGTTFYIDATVWNVDRDTGVPSSDLMSWRRLTFRGAPKSLKTCISGPKWTLTLEVNADLKDISKAKGNKEGWKWHTTVYTEACGRHSDGKDDPDMHNLWSYVSKDGLNWKFQGTIAEKSLFPASYAGPSEASTLLLADGRLLCLFRVQDTDQPLWTAVSDDAGVTWNLPGPVRSPSNATVLPNAITLENGVTLLTSGRPGIWIYGSTTPADPESWVPYDVVANHNAQVSNKNYTYEPNPACGSISGGQCSGYASITATSPSTASVCYDQGQHVNGSLADTLIWCIEVFANVFP